MRFLSGIQASGYLHIGNYFGVIRQLINYQQQGEALYFIADWHALTTVHHGPTLRGFSQAVALDFLALGLDPNKAIIFRQSDIRQHAEFAWILASVTPMGLLERAHSYKDKVAQGIAANVALFTYPVLMAADILLYGPDYVPVGQDQKQHLEMTRDICTKFNTAYDKPGMLKMPEALIQDQTATVLGIDGRKMSKSYKNTLDIFAPEDVVRKRIMAIQTDSCAVDAPKTEPAALLMLLNLFAKPDEARAIQQTWQAGGTGYGDYKKRLVDLFFDVFADARARRQDISKHPDYIEEVLQHGAKRAEAIAMPIWNTVVEAIGCGKLDGTNT